MFFHLDIGPYFPIIFIASQSADKALDEQRYNNSNVSITWETCIIRSWLNGYDSSSNSYGRDYTKFNFINTAFTSSERSAIKTTEVANDNNISYGTAGGNDTSDRHV